MFLALYIQIILLCCGRPSKNVQIIRHRCVLTALSSPKQKAPLASGALKCSFVAPVARRASRGADQRAYSSSRAAAISSVMFMVL